jgi:hypothetical protein
MIYVNASEHVYNFHFSEVLYLRNFARNHNYGFTSLVGGCESLRDIEQSKLLSADAIECRFIESEFSFYKICSTLKAVFKDVELDTLPILFLWIDTCESVKILPSLRKIADEVQLSLNIIPIFNRRDLVIDMFDLNTQKFEVDTYSEPINELIKCSCDILPEFGISGSITPESLEKLFACNVIPKFLRLGIFTLNMEEVSSNQELFSTVKKLLHQETLLLDSIRVSLNQRHDLIAARQHHLMNYLLNTAFQ